MDRCQILDDGLKTDEKAQKESALERANEELRIT
jgi:hypothetical protein